jgi:hypothetical protein
VQLWLGQENGRVVCYDKKGRPIATHVEEAQARQQAEAARQHAEQRAAQAQSENARLQAELRRLRGK